jgi:predicted nucleic acid-binding protein
LIRPVVWNTSWVQRQAEKLPKQSKILAEKDEEYAMDVVSYTQTGKVIELDADLSLQAARLSRKYKLPLADSIIYATSLRCSAVIFSCDAHFKDIPDIQYFPKNSA